MKRLVTLALALNLSAACGVAFAEHTHMDMQAMDSSTKAANATHKAVGVVEKLDQAKGVVTITHEPVQSLGWPGMTMDFVIKDKKLFGKLSVGKKINFEFMKQTGSYIVVDIKK